MLSIVLVMCITAVSTSYSITLWVLAMELCTYMVCYSLVVLSLCVSTTWCYVLLAVITGYGVLEFPMYLTTIVYHYHCISLPMGSVTAHLPDPNNVG